MAWSKSTRITVMLAIDAAFFLLELGVGLWVGSLALMADAFHMLNDIISLAVGLWAVKAAQKSSTDKYSFGWLRAEILGAFANAVFLIALCFSILLDAVVRLFDPPSISNPMLILIVGSLGLASNLAGFFVLGGHGHSHGSEGHSHGNEVRDAEEGHSHSSHTHTSEEEEAIVEVFPEVIVYKAKKGQQLRFNDAETSPSKSRSSPRKHRRSTSGRITNIDQISIHPASFRQDIISMGRGRLDGNESDANTESEGEAEQAVEDAPTETSVLLPKGNGIVNGKGQHVHEDGHITHPDTPRHDSWHDEHNHNKPKKPSKGSHSHSHSDMGMNAMILHVIGDALGNIGVIVSALVIWLTTWSGRFYADPAVSLFITLIILRSTIPLTMATAKILLQATPDHIDVNNIKEDIQELPGVVSCHHVHIWQLSDTQIVASMHIQIAFPISEASGEKYMDLAKAARKCLHAYGIHSATLQPEFCLDKDHDHDTRSLGMDGIVGQPRCRLDDDCLIECVDDCQDTGCCISPITGGSQHSQHSHDDHEGHDHTH